MTVMLDGVIYNDCALFGFVSDDSVTLGVIDDCVVLGVVTDDCVLLMELFIMTVHCSVLLVMTL